jgi:hypothetical protein
MYIKNILMTFFLCIYYTIKVLFSLFCILMFHSLFTCSVEL